MLELLALALALLDIAVECAGSLTEAASAVRLAEFEVEVELELEATASRDSVLPEIVDAGAGGCFFKAED